MGEKYRVSDNQLEISGKDVTYWRHKYLVYLGSFYVKEIEEHKGKMYVDLLEGDKTLVAYRDSIHSKHVGWKMPLIELIVSYMKVAYLISKGVVYVPFSRPENFIYNENTTRVQIGGRYDDTLQYIDKDFLWWVLEMIGFIISDVRPEEFGTLTFNEYYDRMDKEHRELYEGYLRSGTFEELVEYTLEKTVIDVLDEYSPITRPPINNIPKVRDVLSESTELYNKRMKEKQKDLEQRRLREEQTIQEKQDRLDQARAEEEKGSFVQRIMGTVGIKSIKKREKRPKKIDTEEEITRRENIRKNQIREEESIEVKPKTKKRRRKRGVEAHTDRYREKMGIPDDLEEASRKRKGSRVIPTILSLLVLSGVLYLVYQFYITVWQ